MKKLVRSRRARGFTLTELMVSLVMGLIVALAAVSLARTATTSFHEQARSSQTEMALRSATERLRLDLMRASYMSTGNILVDPKVAMLNSSVNNAAAIARYGTTTVDNNLRGIRIDPAGKATYGSIPAPLLANGLAPDVLDLVGNFMTDDAYSGVIQMGTGSVATNSCSGNAQVITLDPTGDAATYNLGGGTPTTAVSAAVLLRNATTAFYPVANQAGIAVVTDAIGCTNYVPVCGVGLVGGSAIVQIAVDGRSTPRAVLYGTSSSSTGNEGAVGLAHKCGSSENGPVTIAPLQHIRWSLQQATGVLANPFAGDGGSTTNQEDPSFDLVRQAYDFDNAPLGGAEVIAEYAVDLKFGITYDDPTKSGQARQQTLDLDSDNGNGAIWTVMSAATTTANQVGPQRVRSVKFRIAIRTAVTDRTTKLTTGAEPFLARFCTTTQVTGIGACASWARVRTNVSEVALTNQFGMNY